ncbi:conserved hypothetical protein [Ricinus communis]|uniref:Uncharacterized protein n=1 Tax=Ricinus communis TaxID=3988 RepID=B9RPY3_RICCO|nr:conserved hypothetical protein [Ricinus communis]
MNERREKGKEIRNDCEDMACKMVVLMAVLRAWQYILEEPIDDIPTTANQGGSHHRASSSSSSAPSIEATLQYHHELLHWFYDGVSNICHNQGIEMALRPVFPSASTATGINEFHNDDIDNEVGNDTNVAYDDGDDVL